MHVDPKCLSIYNRIDRNMDSIVKIEQLKLFYSYVSITFKEKRFYTPKLGTSAWMLKKETWM